MERVDVPFDGMEYLIALIRYGVLGDRPDMLLPSSQVDWDRMMDVASSQGILAWVWDGICKLPKEFQPPRQQAISWGLSAQEIWDRYNKQKHVLRQMIDICNQNNIRLLLFKGIALSELYPRPESRPSSDIDIYLFEDYLRGDQLFARENVTKTNKRTGFDYKGVHIENHRIFLNTYTETQKKAIAYLEDTLKDSTLTKDGYYVMSPIASIIYQVMHFMAHLDDVANPLSLRFVIDFGITMNHYQGHFSPDELKTILQRLSISNLFCLLLRLVKDTLDIEYEYFSCERVDPEDSHAVLKLIFARQGDYVPLIERSFFERSRFYINLYKKYDRIYKYLPKSRFKYVIHYVSELISISVRRIFHIPNNITYVQFVKMKLYG
jgi:hypothetical protein